MVLNYLRQYAKPESVIAEPAEEPLPIDGLPAHDILGGYLYETPMGACVVADSSRHHEDMHGLHPLGGLGTVEGRHLALISRDPELQYAELSRAVFLDTETTGLGMGTGTYVFLVGAGYVEDQHFKVRQFFLREPGEEGAFLWALQEFLHRFSVLVTFNGKAFDWPLLESRFVGHRQFRRAPLDDPLHVDLLHPARRLWKRRLHSCALSSLESNILGAFRTADDVPGWIIPSLYFDYLRSGDASALRGVFYHNLHDILSLATLTVHIASVLSDPWSGLVSDGRDFFSLGRAFEGAGDLDMANACYEEALGRDLPDVERDLSLTWLAAMYKRERRWDAALPIWDRIIDASGPGAVAALVERAKYFEHVDHDYLEALDDVQRALNLLALRGDGGGDIDRRELEHRQGRLITRVYRDRSWSPTSG